MSLIKNLISMAKEISRMDENDLNKEIDQLKVKHKLEEEIQGKANFDTTLRSHLLIGAKILCSEKTEQSEVNNT